MPSNDASILGSGDPEFQAEAKADAIERAGGEENYDPELNWTAQQGPMPENERTQSREPQQFLPQQLPDPEAARSAGVPPQQIPESQINADAIGHPNGPEPGELVRMGLVDVAEPEHTDYTTISEQQSAEEAESAAAGHGGAPDDTWTKADIQQYADENGIEGVSMSMNKDEMLAAVEAGA